MRVPDESTEALRDLVRARDDAKRVERAARHRLSKFLLRHDRRYSRPTAWTGIHLEWIRKQTFEHEAQNRVLREYLHSVDDATSQVARLTQDIEDSGAGSRVAGIPAPENTRLTAGHSRQFVEVELAIK